MANKELTARVRIDANQAHRTLDKLVAKINKINKVVNNAKADTAITKQLVNQEKINQAKAKTALLEERVTTQQNKSAVAAQKVSEATTKAQIAEQKLMAQTARTTAVVDKLRNVKEQVSRKTTSILDKVRAWASNQRAVTSATKSTNTTLSSIGSKLKGIAATYLGIMGMRTAVKTSDTITSTQNKLNNLNGGDTELTQQQMDKMYVSANKVRMAYTDMMSNASKSMTLAGDAFQGNMDNAIRFQEIMAETYALGGASAEEMSTSMYQMIQALGAGTLAGDELRSVREGAPLAYKAIEDYVQGVMKQSEATKDFATKSLKDIAAEGLVTSEMVVAAVMAAGKDIDDRFNKTHWTFEQAWDRIKNSAVKAFEPVSNALNKMLNDAAKNGMFEKIESAFWNISKALQIIFKVIYNSIVWIADNWSWLQHIVVAGLIIMAAMWLYQAGVAVVSCIKTLIALGQVAWTIITVVAGILALIYVFYLWKTSAIDTCTAIATALLIVGVVVGIIMLLFGNLWGLVVIGAAIAIYFIITKFAELCGYVNIGIQAIVNAWFWMCNLAIGVWNWIKAVATNTIKGIGNVAVALSNSICAICENIGIAFNNAWHGALSGFWDFVASCMEGLNWLAKPIAKIAELFGKSFSYEDFTASIRAKANAHSDKMKDYVSVSDAWNSGMNTYQYENLGDAWSSGWNTYDVFQDGWSTDAYNHGYDWGKDVETSINAWGSQFQTGGGSTSMLDNIGSALGLDFGSGFPNGGDVSGAYNAPGVDDMIKNALGDIKDDTGKMANSMDLAEEDLEFLRKLADTEWKKEFTTANITVDMSNYNTINGESDLDGIVTKLSDKLREELNVVANGVYA